MGNTTGATADQIRAEEQRQLRQALEHIQEAQNHLGRAGAILSNFERGAPVWTAAAKLYDRVHAFWYRVEGFRKSGLYRLDSLSLESFEKRLAALEKPRG
jgi:hypothetical protein